MSTAARSSPAAAWVTRPLQVRLVTPAFLGNAAQDAEWRTPPLKALLRQWWRVALNAKLGDARDRLEQIRRAEAALFGSVAGDQGWQSLVRMRLDGRVPAAEAPQFGKVEVTHPEVQRAPGNRIDPFVYLGYGPIQIGKLRRWLPAGPGATWRLAFPRADMALLDQALQLISWFGAVGSRSRNGWGSLELSGGEIKPLAAAKDLLPYCRPLAQSLDTDWPDALGSDQRGPLVWISQNAWSDWRAAVPELAQNKIDLRVNNFKFKAGRDGPLEARHLFGLPITNHSIGGMAHEARWASQLRIKFFRDAARVRIMCFHVPARIPEARPGLPAGPTPARQAEFWRSVHSLLDKPDDGGFWKRLV